jgi:hypothetical protein
MRCGRREKMQIKTWSSICRFSGTLPDLIGTLGGYYATLSAKEKSHTDLFFSIEESGITWRLVCSNSLDAVSYFVEYDSLFEDFGEQFAMSHFGITRKEVAQKSNVHSKLKCTTAYLMHKIKQWAGDD